MITKIYSWHLNILILITAIFLLLPPSMTEAQIQSLELEVNQSYFYSNPDASDIIRVAVVNPKIADVSVINNQSLNIIAISPGSTSLTVWFNDGTLQQITVCVAATDSNSANTIKKAINIPGVSVEKVDGKILLQGTVVNQYEKEQAQNIASLFVENKDQVINLLEMSDPVQINLAALVIDITTSDARDIGIITGSTGAIGNSSLDFSGITFGSFYGGQDYKEYGSKFYNNINFKLNALIQDGKAKILSRPNITALSGKEAEILIGGEIPIPTSKQGDISVTWREYGIKLHIQPTATPDLKITTKVVAEISSLDSANAVSTTAGKIPALISRKASTSINIPDGHTMAIGGLMNNSDSKTVSKIPILSSIPIIGEFFKNTSTSKDKHELIILITPTIVDSNNDIKASDRMINEIEEARNNYNAMKKINPNKQETDK
ncbi:MAG: pilus assembly protein N-terminal domain-containing protein [Anaerovibrio sp.]|uniref:type II and III secretion system protein family protein n=1 Tax=Anaerovibrio sp. TaxID=1872532 RepID=UPI002600D2C0|nr:pilus assembly protein N-terminal domain-containing protein [Anaerovibrio sp.]MCR5177118.1 pilus assembly protein N-terminal domain-containing protein [Anaerovibrio sp.]